MLSIITFHRFSTFPPGHRTVNINPIAAHYYVALFSLLSPSLIMHANKSHKLAALLLLPADYNAMMALGYSLSPGAGDTSWGTSPCINCCTCDFVTCNGDGTISSMYAVYFMILGVFTPKRPFLAFFLLAQSITICHQGNILAPA